MSIRTLGIDGIDGRLSTRTPTTNSGDFSIRGRYELPGLRGIGTAPGNIGRLLDFPVTTANPSRIGTPGPRNIANALTPGRLIPNSPDTSTRAPYRPGSDVDVILGRPLKPSEPVDLTPGRGVTDAGRLTDYGVRPSRLDVDTSFRHLVNYVTASAYTTTLFATLGVRSMSAIPTAAESTAGKIARGAEGMAMTQAQKAVVDKKVRDKKEMVVTVYDAKPLERSAWSAALSYGSDPGVRLSAFPINLAA